MVGAGVLAAWGALRSGSGLVTLATVRSQQASAAAKLRPEAMTLGLKETSNGAMSANNLSTIIQWIVRRKITSLVIGPGLSRNVETARLIRRLLQRLERNSFNVRGIALDADGFLAVGKGGLSKTRLPIVATPHPGELKKFTGASVGDGSAERILAAEKFAKLYRVTCVLKGHKTVISDGRHSYVNSTGNPGMARGGCGDVLSGMIGALISQFGTSLYLLRSACIAVYVHGLAGDLAAKQKTQLAMLPGDLAELIPDAFKKFQ